MEEERGLAECHEDSESEFDDDSYVPNDDVEKFVANVQVVGPEEEEVEDVVSHYPDTQDHVRSEDTGDRVDEPVLGEHGVPETVEVPRREESAFQEDLESLDRGEDSVVPERRTHELCVEEDVQQEPADEHKVTVRLS